MFGKNTWSLVFLLAGAAWAASEGGGRVCDMQLDAEAAQQLKQSFRPVVAHAGVQLPESCPFHPVHDRMANMRVKQSRARGQRWICAFCKQRFENQESVQHHMEAAHSSRVPDTSKVCYSDYCDILGCHSWKKAREANRGAPCDEADMKRKRFRCESLFHRCLPDAPQLYDVFSRKYCSRLSCDASAARDVVLELHEAQWSDLRVLKYLGAFFLVLFFAVYYVVMCVYRSDSRMDADLKRLSGSNSSSRIKAYFSPKKLKGY